MAGMTQGSGHADIGPELRRLAQAILDRLDPALRAAANAAGGAGGPGPCQQVWCPVCALAALVTGGQHPLLTVVAEHSVALTAVIAAMVADAQTAGGGTPAPPSDGEPAPPAPGNGAGPRRDPANGDGAAASRYQHIPIVVEPVIDDD